MTRKRRTGLVDYFRVRRVFRTAFRALAMRHYKGEPQLTQLALRDGRTFWVHAGTGEMDAVWNIFIKDEYRTESLFTGRYECVVDIGANIGLFSMRIAPRARRILAFEPEPSNFQLLRRNIGSDSPCAIELISKAVSDRAGVLRICLSSIASSHHSAFPPPGFSGDAYVDVEAIRLPDFLDERKISRIDLLKIDCEGAEYGILASLQSWGLDRIARIAMEYHAVEGASAETHSGEAVERLLQDAGFRVTRVVQKPALGMIYAERHSISS